MSNVVTIFLYELKRNVRRRGYLFMTFGVPLLILVLMLGYNVIQSQQQPDEAAQANEILNQFDFEGVRKAGIVDPANVFPEISQPLQGILTLYPDEASATAALNDKQVDVFYVVDPDYLQNGVITLYLPNFALDKLTSTPVEQLFYTTLASNIDPQLLARLRSPIQITQVNLELDSQNPQDEDANFLMLYVFAIIFLLGMFLTNGYLLQSVIEEKETKVVEILITSITSTELLMGKILAFALLGILQIVSWVIFIGVLISVATRLPAFQTVAAIMNLRLPFEKLPVMFLYFLLGYLFFAGVFGAVGAISNSMREGPSYAAIFTLPAAFPFYFFSIFQATPNAPLPVFLSIFPLTSPISMMMRITSTTVPTEQIVLSLGLLAFAALGMMWAAGRIFRVNSLLSGKVPKLKDLPSLLRG